MIQTIPPTMLRTDPIITNDNRDALQSKIKSSNQSQSQSSISPPSYPIPVTPNNTNSTYTRPYTVAESQRNDDSTPSETSSNGTFRAPIDRVDRSVPAGLAPTGMLRQHSSGTARFLESSLFDDSIDPLSMDQPPVNPPQFFSQPSYESTDDRRKQDPQNPSQATTFDAAQPSIHPVHLTNSNQSSKSNPSPQSVGRTTSGLPTFIPPEAFFFSGYPTSASTGEFQTNQSPRSVHPFFSSPDWQPPPNQRSDSILAMFRQNSDYQPGAPQPEFSSQSPANSTSLFNNNAQQFPKGSLTRFLSGQNMPALESPERAAHITTNVVAAEERPVQTKIEPITQSHANQQNLAVHTISSNTSAPSSPASHGSHSRPTSPSSHGSSERRSSNRHKDGEPRKKRVKREVDNDGDSVGSVQSHGSSKDRHVNTAFKLRTNEDDDSGEPLMQTHVRQIFYERPDAKPHRIRLIEVVDVKTRARSMYAHGADVGSVVERKSNISRLFGKFTSPDEKLLMNVPGSHNHTVGQESNILTEAGIERFLSTNKMRGQEHYRKWITERLIPLIRAANAGLSFDCEDATDRRENDYLTPGSIPSSPGSVGSHGSYAP